jgi:hypothetical protein
MTMKQNFQLALYARYDDWKIVRHLFKNYTNFERLAEAGDSEASAIFIDMRTGLYSKVITDKQRASIVELYVNGNTVKDAAEALGKNETTVLESANAGIKKIQKALESGTLYRKGDM